MVHSVKSPARPSIGFRAVARVAVVCFALGAMGNSCSSTIVPASVSIPGGDVEVAGIIDPHLHFNVPVMLNGQGPYYFLVDTGAAATVISTRLGSSLPPANDSSVSVVGAGSASGNLVQIDSISIGSMQFKNFVGLVLDVSDTAGGFYYGIIGLPVFHNVTMRIDYPRKTLRVQTSLLDQNACNRPIEGADLTSPHILTLASTGINVAGRDVQARLDTGSESFLDLPSSFSNLPWTGPLTDTTSGGVGIQTGKRGTLNGLVQVGCFSYKNQQINLGVLDTPNLGAGGWQTLILFLDQRSKLMRLQTPDCLANPDCINPDQGVACTSSAGTWSTDLGEMTLYDNAASGGVSGEFTQGHCGTFFGTTGPGTPSCPDCVTLTGRWITYASNDQTCLPKRRFDMDDSGPIEFVFSADFSTFTGKWAYYDANNDGQLDNDWQPWNGIHTVCK